MFAVTFMRSWFVDTVLVSIVVFAIKVHVVTFINVHTTSAISSVACITSTDVGSNSVVAVSIYRAGVGVGIALIDVCTSDSISAESDLTFTFKSNTGCAVVNQVCAVSILIAIVGGTDQAFVDVIASYSIACESCVTTALGHSIVVRASRLAVASTIVSITRIYQSSCLGDSCVDI